MQQTLVARKKKLAHVMKSDKPIYRPSKKHSCSSNIQIDSNIQINYNIQIDI